MLVEFYKQRRNLLIISSIIILIHLTETDILSLFPILGEIKIEKLNFLFINSYSDLLFCAFIYFFCRFFSYAVDFEKENLKKSNEGVFFYYSIDGKFFNIFSMLIEKFLSKGIYDIFIPLYLSSIIMFGYIFSAFTGIEDKRIVMIIGGFFLTVIFLLIMVFELKYTFFKKNKIKREKKDYNYIKKDTQAVYYRNLYNDKKEKLLNKKYK